MKQLKNGDKQILIKFDNGEFCKNCHTISVLILVLYFFISNLVSLNLWIMKEWGNIPISLHHRVFFIALSCMISLFSMTTELSCMLIIVFQRLSWHANILYIYWCPRHRSRMLIYTCWNCWTASLEYFGFGRNSGDAKGILACWTYFFIF